jgi:hypothetical protein
MTPRQLVLRINDNRKVLGSPRARAIISALTVDPTRSYDAIAKELGVSCGYVRSVASRMSRQEGACQLRRKKPYRERRRDAA